MPSASFHAASIPLNKVGRLSPAGGYSHFYAATKPDVPLAGDWTKRYCTLADSFQSVLDAVYNFRVREDDVWIVTSMKCGTTWMQEMTWLIANNYDFQTAKEVDVDIRSPFLEYKGCLPEGIRDTIMAADNQPSPRVIKSHLPAFLLPRQLWTKKPKIIYVFRDPRDAAISCFHHWRGRVGYCGTKEDFLHSYLDGYVNFTPFWPHVLDFWQLRCESNIYFTSYERMSSNLHAVIRDVCHFLQKPVSEDQLTQLNDHLCFEKMKHNPACSHEQDLENEKKYLNCELPDFRFVRRGIVGSHKDEMPLKIIHKFDEWTEEHLKGYQLTLDDLTNYAKYKM